MIDIHTHVLPGVDDGPESLREAVEMCRIAASDGIEAVVATPHQRHEQWLNTDRARLEKLRRQVQREIGTSPRLILGAEIAVDSELLSELESSMGGGLIPLAGSRYLLLELDPLGIGPDPLWLVHELVIEGWIPIFAHAERVLCLAEDLSLVAELARRGALFQITAMAVTGELGRELQSRSVGLLDGELVDFVASDMHGTDGRPPGMSRAYGKVASRWGEQTARRLTKIHPKAVLENRTLTGMPLRPPVPAPTPAWRVVSEKSEARE